MSSISTWDVNDITQHENTDVNSSFRITISSTWIILALGVVLAVATASQCHTGDARAIANPKWAPSLLYGAVLWFWWSAIAVFMWKATRRWPSLSLLSLGHGLRELTIGLGLSFIHVGLLRETNHFMIHTWPYLRTIGYDNLVFFDIGRIAFETFLYMVVWGTCGAIHTQIARQSEAIQNAKLKEQLSSAHLHALQMQMEPHFLLNTLNAITALVEDGSQREAVETLGHLNAILKSTLVRKSPEKVSLAQELAVVEHYLAIEQIRFADRLRVEISVDPGALDSMIPCFLLQPIVENAIRHGISPMEDEGIIHASVERRGEMLHLKVRDNGPGIHSQSQKGHGIGLRNTEDRLAHFYPKNYAFESGQGATGGFEVFIAIPYERAFA